MLKPPLYCLAGWGFAPSVWDGHPFADNWHVLDYPEIDTVLDSAQMLEQAITRLADQIADQSILLGWSLGGALLAAVAAAFPQKCKHLITFNSSPCFIANDQWPGIQQQDFQALYDLALNDWPACQKHFLTLVCYPNKDRLLRGHLKNHFLKKSVTVGYLQLLGQLDFRECYYELHCQQTHLLAKQDAIVPIQTLAAWQKISDASWHSLASTGHALLFSQPDILQKVMS